jgi:hypothetical protein
MQQTSECLTVCAITYPYLRIDHAVAELQAGCLELVGFVNFACGT